MCGNCKYFKPSMNIPAGLELYGRCQHPCGGFHNQIKYDYSASCKDYETNKLNNYN